MMKKILCFLFLLMCLFLSACQSNNTIAVIPLDSRPINTHDSVLMGKMNGKKVLLPPSEAMDNYVHPGNPSALFHWLNMQKSTHYIIFANELLMGGLIASRDLDQVEQWRRQMPELERFLNNHRNAHITVVSVLPRHLPSQFDSVLKPHSDALAQWSARLDEAAATGNTVPKPPADIPPEAADRYRQLFLSHQAMNEKLMTLAQKGEIDELVISQDDYAPRSLSNTTLRHLQSVAPKIKGIRFTKGADELLMMLLAPRNSGEVRVIYTDPTQKDQIPAYEGQPLSQTVADKLAFLDIHEAANAQRILLVYNTPDQPVLVNQTRAENPHSYIGLADVAYTNHGDWSLWSTLTSRPYEITAYSGWNTAGNTLGTTLAWMSTQMAYQEPIDTSSLKHIFSFAINNFDAIITHQFIHPKERFDAQVAFWCTRVATDQIYLGHLAPNLKNDWRRKGLIDSTGAFSSPKAQKEVETQLNLAATPYLRELPNPHGHFHFTWPRTFEVAYEE